MQLFYLDGLAGSSKTEVMIQDIERRINSTGERFIYTVPGTVACDEICSRFLKQGITPKVIYTGYNVGLKANGTYLPVNQAVSSWLQSLDEDYSGVLILTHSALHQLEEFPQHVPIHTWNLIHDETFDPTIQLDLKLPNFHRVILSYIQAERPKDEFSPISYIGEDSVKDLKKKHILNKDGDIVSALISDFFKALILHLDRRGTFYVETSSIVALQEGTGKAFAGVFVYNPSLFGEFKSATIISANFRNDLVYNLWKQHFGVQWICRTDLKDKLTFLQHQTPLQVHYVLDSSIGWSKYKADFTHNNKTIREYFEDIAREFISSEPSPVLVMCNKGDRVGELPNAVSCEFNSQGLNKYMHLKAMVYSGAFNRVPSYYRFMQWLGCADSVRISQNSGHLYQTLLRGIVRLNSTETMKLLVPSLSLFNDIEYMFANITYYPVTGKVAEIIRDRCKKQQQGRKKATTPLEQRQLEKKLKDSARAAKFRERRKKQ